MKCVCGYEYECRYINGIETPTKGNEPFIDFEIISSSYPVKLPGGITGYERDKTVTLYACPICGTLKIEV